MKNTNPNYLIGKINTLGDVAKNIFYRELDSYYHSNIKVNYADKEQYNDIKRIIVNMLKQHNVVTDSQLEEASKKVFEKIIQINNSFNELKLDNVIPEENEILYELLTYIESKFNSREQLIDILNKLTPNTMYFPNINPNLIYHGYFNCSRAFAGVNDAGNEPGSNKDRKYRFNHTLEELQKELLFTLIYIIDINGNKELLNYIDNNNLYKSIYMNMDDPVAELLYYKIRELITPEYKIAINNMINYIINTIKDNNK